jgi:hypothetical protein
MLNSLIFAMISGTLKTQRRYVRSHLERGDLYLIVLEALHF